MSEITLLERLQEQVVDGDPIDWAALSLHSLTPDDAAARVHPAARTAGPRPHVVSPGRGDSDDGQRPAVDGPGGGARRGSAADAGPLRLEACVGRGGFGSVYRAWDPELEMPVAIKILHTRLHGDELKARLLHEGRALAQMRHPNVVRVLNVEQNDDRLGLVMEFPRGETLDARVAAHRLMNDRVAMVVAEDVCRALAAVHANRLKASGRRPGSPRNNTGANGPRLVRVPPVPGAFLRPRVDPVDLRQAP